MFNLCALGIRRLVFDVCYYVLITKQSSGERRGEISDLRASYITFHQGIEERTLEREYTWLSPVVPIIANCLP